MIFSVEDDRCVVCMTPKTVHDEMLARFGEIRFVLPTFMAAKFIFESDPYPSLESAYLDVKTCREFVRSMEIFDRFGDLIPLPASG
jgi:hypothetical protein